MRRILPLLLTGCMLLTLNACAFRASSASDTTAMMETTPEAETSHQPPSPSSEAETLCTTEDDTLSVNIWREDFPVFEEPSYDHHPKCTVGIAGFYTILETYLDSEGNNWGRLESIDGWVDLSLNESESLNIPPVTVSLADEELLTSGNYHYCNADSSEYAYDVAFRSHDVLTDVSFFPIIVTDGYIRDSELFHIPSWNPGMPFVATISFPGDSSTFGLEFTDSRGITQIYGISQSGRNGSINIYPLITPTSSAESGSWIYQIVREDHSYRNSAGKILIDHYYEYVEILSYSPIAQKINYTIQQSVSRFFMSDSDLAQFAQGIDSHDTYVCTQTSHITYISDNFLCIRIDYAWFAGGVFSDESTGWVFNLTTGELATLQDFANGDTANFEACLKAIVWLQIKDDSPWDDAYETLQSYTLDTFCYTIQEGQIVLHFPEYKFFPGAYGPVTIYTGIYI